MLGLRQEPPPAWVGIVAAAALVALTTLILFPLEQVAPAISLGVVYVPAVLIVSIVWRWWLGVLTAVACAAAFNWFHIPPTGRFTVAEAQNWVALAAFLTVALVSSTVAQVARMRAEEADMRRGEADLAAEAARVLLGEEELGAGLAIVADRVAEALDLPSAAIVEEPPAADPRREAIPLGGAGHLVVPSGLPAAIRQRLAGRIAPALAPVVTAARERAELQREVVETAALRQSDVAKTAVLRAVSHDLRSPLTAMVTAGEALRSPSLEDEEREELASVVFEEGGRLSRLIEKLIDLSRLQAGTNAPRPGSVALDEVLRAAVDDVRDGGRFHLSLGELPPLRVDAAQLERAFANLLENAARYSGGQPVSVRARALHNRVVVRVVDRGPGIPHAEQQRIFEPFYRVDGGPGHAGSGLGLAIVRGLVEANGGRVWVESLPGQGSTFVVELPLEPVGAAA